MVPDILKGFAIGICASMPLGPVAIFVLQKSLSGGHKAGFLTGLGATVIDTMYAILAIFALALTEDFLQAHSTIVLIAGGSIVICIGLSMLLRDPFRKVTTDADISYSIKDMLKASLMDIANPGAILIMLALFAFFKVQVEEHDFRIAPVILAISAGSACYWFFFSKLFSHFRKSFKVSTLVWIGKICGAIVLIIGLALLAEGLMKQLFMN